jgi:hypothetical protein
MVDRVSIPADERIFPVASMLKPALRTNQSPKRQQNVNQARHLWHSVATLLNPRGVTSFPRVQSNNCKSLSMFAKHAAVVVFVLLPYNIPLIIK